MLLLYIVAASIIIICLTAVLDAVSQIWAEKRAFREAEKQRLQEAKNALAEGIRLKAARANQTTIKLNVVAMPGKPARGRHRLSAA
jgi:hypothetical protein